MEDLGFADDGDVQCIEPSPAPRGDASQAAQVDALSITETADRLAEIRDEQDPEVRILLQIQYAKRIVEQCRSMPELQRMRAEAAAIQELAKQQKASEEVKQSAAELNLRIVRRIGMILKALPKNRGAAARLEDRTRLHAATASPPATLDELGVEKTQSSRWQKIAALSDDAFEKYLCESREAGEDITQQGALRKAISNASGHSSESNEHYTPRDIIEAAREVLGTIDLDPASCLFANQIVGAATIYTEADDGLSKPWFGNVWINPPFGKGEDNGSNKGRWSRHLIEQYLAGKVDAAILLVNPDIGTEWFWRFWELEVPICFTRKRIRFYNEDGVQKSPPRGGAGAIIYLGPEPQKFAEVFRQFGVVVTSVVRMAEAQKEVSHAV